MYACVILITACVNPNIQQYPLIGEGTTLVQLPELSKIKLYENGNFVEYLAFKYSISVSNGTIKFINAKTHDTKNFKGLFIVE